MDTNAEKQRTAVDTRIRQGYPAARLARALATAVTHEDADTRARAERRVGHWREVLGAMASGAVTVGSRTPVAGLPAWVTPQVVHGGFATGAASAGGPLLPYELAAAARAGVPADRRALFGHFLTDQGLAELTDLLDRGCYEVAVPEEAALLTVAWLVRAGDRLGALDLLDTLEPFAGQLRFTPRPAGAPAADATLTHRRTVGQVREAVAARRPHPAVEAMNEALAVWNPFADELLAHWLETASSGRVLARLPDDAWHGRGAALLTRYRELAAVHTRCRKHRRPKENQAVLCTALEEVVAGRTPDARAFGLLQHAVDSMVAKRGLPGSAPHTALRDRQASVAARPTHHALAQLVARRLSELPQDTGTPDIDTLSGPVTEEEQRACGLPAGAAVPEPVRRVVLGALSAPVGTLVERGVVPSAEVLAELVPQLVSATTALAHPDQALRALAAANHRAFRNRRSLLLLDLQHQVRVEELPWVRAVAAYRDAGGQAREAARTTLVQLGELAVQGFPATLLPNPLVRELSALAASAGVEAPFVEELAIDIFMGRFSAKFLDAAVVAGDLLGGTLYERYYGIDYAALAALGAAGGVPAGGGTAADRERGRAAKEFGRLCRARAGDAVGWSGNAMVIEQAQILTTHNLATLVVRAGVEPRPGWADLARRCFTAVCALTARLHRDPQGWNTVKDAAYAWRQMLFHLSLCGAEERAEVVAWTEVEAARHPGRAADRLAPALAGLRLVAAGGEFRADGTAEGGRARRLLGRSGTGHWLRQDLPGAARPA
ncbi:hypothetical protein OG689_30750 [Kitasatospora sp. NBC_00240]|uniref:hypothetical protein n=1 Tax=Kitasatospora sp. NBC_00240 TaxID=2903567 RepID=UPI0022547203|nr:hypothetical protein [Kitasatospora sp. NBC_00240]MCX5213598.1 hypothetical protein [Kitasatospora sp. NBC_00240]